MSFIIGFLIWLALGLLGGGIIRAVYKAPRTSPALTLIFGIFGAFIGGMLGVAGYVYHDPTPVRVGGLIGAAAGALLFSFIYHLIDRTAV